METKQERRTRRAETMTAAIKALYAVESCTPVDSGEHAHIKKTRALLVKLRQQIAGEMFDGDREWTLKGSRWSVRHWSDCVRCAELATVWCRDDDCNEGLVETADCGCADCEDLVGARSLDNSEGSRA